MIVAISFGDKRWKAAQHLNARTARRFGADKVIRYTPDDLDEEFCRKNRSILEQKRGYGYWIWKPYVLHKALQTVQDGDYVMYVDCGAAYVNDISNLIRVMERDKQDVMCFCIRQMERRWNKRDNLILQEADTPEILESNQICGGYILLRKTERSCKLIEQFLAYVQDERMLTDMPNVLGVDNYPDFIEHRHDQAIWSVLCKKNHILPYRDPSQYAYQSDSHTKEGIPFPQDVLDRSTFPQIVESHRHGNCRFYFELRAADKWYHAMCRFFYNGLVGLKKKIVKH